ncbi:MAG: mechanosensitive ion channel family protein [Alphaproteobacteria bacterium]|nr:mechanosensitive ion channel family protein [Alphaproteobacteria bacterium]NCQ87647.1 mechanosensitive ion channel family protein [Alphaproteobacteria bacterium]NCT05844.1 mechanosensitive ion channel family protein [Alphaproteobacteria bacterium]
MTVSLEQYSTEMFEFLSNHFFVRGAITSVLIVIGILILRLFIIRFIKNKKEILNKDQRRWINRVNNGASTALIVGLILIWAPQLQTFALSLTAVAVAVVLTTKELLMCLTGGFLIVSNKNFDVGDWITIDDVTGEVMKMTAMTTSLEKIDVTGKSYQFTGEIVHIPNSRFLSLNVENTKSRKDYIYHEFSIVTQYTDFDTKLAMNKLKEMTQGYFAPFEDKAVQFNKRLEKKAGVDFPDPHPQYFIKTTELGHNAFIVKFFVPTDKALFLSSQITEDFLSYIHKQKTNNKKKSSKAD